MTIPSDPVRGPIAVPNARMPALVGKEGLPARYHRGSDIPGIAALSKPVEKGYSAWPQWLGT